MEEQRKNMYVTAKKMLLLRDGIRQQHNSMVSLRQGAPLTARSLEQMQGFNQ
jgi:hypothetical protein